MTRLPIGRLVIAAAVTGLILVSIGWLARAPYAPPGNDAALLRLSWRFRPDAAENCRPRTQAELDALPVHMRTPDVCVDERVVYRVIRQLDGGAADTIRVLRGGIKQDRPVYVLLDTMLEPATYRVRVSLTREREHALQEPVLPPLDTTIHIGAGDVGLITLDAEGVSFVARGPAVEH